MGRTVFVLGAGVSFAYGYPLGTTLIDKIKEKLRKNHEYSEERELLSDLEAINPFSIDSFLKDRPKHDGIAKSLISEILYELEDPKTFEAVEARSDFYRFLYDQYRNAQFDEFDITTFNYDRSLEFYFSRAIAAQKGVDISTAFAELQKIKIIHIHGRLGFLPGEQSVIGTTDQGRREYGFLKGDLSRVSTPAIAAFGGPSNRRPAPWEETRDKILRPVWQHGREAFKTIYQNDACNNEAHELLHRAERVFFLGFGYHELNMRILGLDFGQRSMKKIVGTSLGLGAMDKRRIKKQFPGLWELYDCSCTDLFANHFCLTDRSLDVI